MGARIPSLVKYIECAELGITGRAPAEGGDGEPASGILHLILFLALNKHVILFDAALYVPNAR